MARCDPERRHRRTKLLLLPAPLQIEAISPSDTRQGQVLDRAQLCGQTILHAVLRNDREACSEDPRGRGHRHRERLGTDRDLPTTPTSTAEDEVWNFLQAAIARPGNADHLAGSNLDAEIGQHLTAHSGRGENHLPFPGGVRIEVGTEIATGQIASQNQLAQLRFRQVTHFEPLAAVSPSRSTVTRSGQAHDFFQPVADDQNARARARDAAHDLVELGQRLARQGLSRLVEHDASGTRMLALQSAGDRDDGALTGAKGADILPIGIDALSRLNVSTTCRRSCAHGIRRLTDPGLILTDSDVLYDAEVSDQAQVLMDEGQAVAAQVSRAHRSRERLAATLISPASAV